MKSRYKNNAPRTARTTRTIISIAHQGMAAVVGPTMASWKPSQYAVSERFFSEYDFMKCYFTSFGRIAITNDEINF